MSDFKILIPEDPDFSLSVEAMREILVPLYGEELIDQLIEKVRLAKDRICEVYYKEGIPRGLIVFKNFLSDEYVHYGIKNGYEQKTTLPMIPNDRAQSRLAMRKKVMEILLNRGAWNAISMNAKCFFGTVSSEKHGTLQLLLRLGFEIAHCFKDKFKTGVDEYLIVHKNLQKLYEITKVN